MFEYDYMKRSMLFIPVKVLISLLVAVAVIKADKPADIIFYTLGTYGIITTVSYLSTYLEHMIATIIAVLAVSIITLILITKIPASILLIIYMAVVVLGYFIDIKKILKFAFLLKNHDKGKLLTESLEKVRNVAAANGYSYDEIFNSSNTQKVDQTENIYANIGSIEAKKALMEFKDAYEKCNNTLITLMKISKESSYELKAKVTPLYDSVEMIYKNEAHTLSDNDIVIKIRRATDTVNSVINEAEVRINGTAGNTNKKEDKPAFDFFDGCNDKESIKKRYRDLMKTYHPDQGNGSESTLKQINNQYENLLKNY